MSNQPLTSTVFNSFSQQTKKKLKVDVFEGRECVSERSEKNFFPNETNHIETKHKKQEFITIEKINSQNNRLFIIEEKNIVDQPKEFNNLSCNNMQAPNDKLILNDLKVKKTHTLNEIICRKRNHIPNNCLCCKEKRTIDLNTIDPS
jgi:hypothetical protein